MLQKFRDLFLYTLHENGIMNRLRQNRERTPQTYYVDSISGDDLYSGKSERKAWKTLDKVNKTTFYPGDKILFRSNGIWTGQLWPKGSGTEDFPIIIDKYGNGNKPIINGEGKAGYINDDPYQTINATLYLYNQQYWEINNLELTNDSNTSSRRRGVWIVGENIGTLNHIYLRNLSIHHVNGDGEKDSLGSAGILFDIKNTGKKSNFNNILIEKNEVSTVNRTGICVASGWIERPEMNGGSTNRYMAHTNVIIRGNVLRDIGGDGIVIINTYQALVEYNTVAKANARSDYHTPNAGIWAWNGDHNVFQFNEVYGTKYGKDSQAYDIDYGQRGTIFQYNYSHDNEGGFMLICADGQGINEDGIVRYNISQNDQRSVFSFGGTAKGTKIYNNTIYLSENSKTNMIWTEYWNGWPENITFENNIFYHLGESDYLFGEAKNITFSHNLFYGHTPKNIEDPQQLNSDPLFVRPGEGKKGINSVDGYKLLENSPAIGTGKVIKNPGSYDYWGNKVHEREKPNRGAYNGAGIKMKDD